MAAVCQLSVSSDRTTGWAGEEGQSQLHLATLRRLVLRYAWMPMGDRSRPQQLTSDRMALQRFVQRRKRAVAYATVPLEKFEHQEEGTVQGVDAATVVAYRWNMVDGFRPGLHGSRCQLQQLVGTPGGGLTPGRPGWRRALRPRGRANGPAR